MVNQPLAQIFARRCLAQFHANQVQNWKRPVQGKRIHASEFCAAGKRETGPLVAVSGAKWQCFPQPVPSSLPQQWGLTENRITKKVLDCERMTSSLWHATNNHWSPSSPLCRGANKKWSLVVCLGAPVNHQMLSYLPQYLVRLIPVCFALEFYHLLGSIVCWVVNDLMGSLTASAKELAKRFPMTIILVDFL